ncbi:MAG: hypothetical protein ACHBNF_21335 [Chromatiales bacterium]
MKSGATARPSAAEQRDHAPIEIAPRRLAVQAEKDLCVARAFVKIVDTEIKS